MENSISYVPMYKSYIDAVSKLTPEDRLVIYEAIFEYGFTGVEPTFDNPYLEMGWNLVKPNLVNNIKRVKANQENGKKGGKKSNSDTPKSTENIESKEVSTQSDTILLKEEKSIVKTEEIDIIDCGFSNPTKIKDFTYRIDVDANKVKEYQEASKDIEIKLGKAPKPVIPAKYLDKMNL